jgi:hypothetical protein
LNSELPICLKHNSVGLLECNIECETTKEWRYRVELTHQPLIYLYNNVLDENIQNCIKSFVLSVIEKKEKLLLMVITTHGRTVEN